VFRWLKAQGGAGRWSASATAPRPELLYSAIARRVFTPNPVAVSCRSWMNVPFTLAVPELDAPLSRRGARGGLANLEGHRSVGGMPREPLQRDAARGRAGPGGFHAGI